ncbi:MAG: hypothetical protein KGL39_42240 [Patescibacteria group bacterium]|nr:hypothetical protein [Patescibacteria group bacterium]
MQISKLKVTPIASGKAHLLADFGTNPDVTAIRLTNLTSATDNLEVFTEETAVAGANCHVIAAGGTHFLEVPADGTKLYGAASAGEVEVEVLATRSALPTVAVG